MLNSSIDNLIKNKKIDRIKFKKAALKLFTNTLRISHNKRMKAYEIADSIFEMLDMI